MPLRTLEDGNIEIVKDIVLSEFAKEKIKISTNELLEERAAVEDLLK
jgi:malate dehydrogenase